MSRPSAERRRARLARRSRSLRGFFPSVQPLEARQLLSVVEPPYGLTATPAGNDRINLAWTDASANEQGFKVERSIDGVTFTQVGTAYANQPTFQMTGLTPGTAYQFRVRAYDASGNSAYSNVIASSTTALVPGAPANLVATAASSSQINLTWIDTTDNEQGYKVERSADGVNFTQIGTASQYATSYATGGLTPGTTYTYRVRAYNAAGDSPYSGTASATTLVVNAPSNLSATVVSGTQVNLTWSDNANNETGFKVERSADGVNFVEVGTAPANPFSYTVSFQATGLAPGTAYHFRVRASNAQGNSAYSNTITARTSTAPAVPSNLTATSAGNDRINLAWTDTSSNEQGFKVERSSDGVSFTQIGTTAAGQTSYAASNLTPGMAYYFRVRAYNGDDSAYSAVASATTATIVPAAPLGLTAVAVSGNQINLAWSNDSDNVQGYKIERSTDGVNFTQIGTVFSYSTSYQATGLSPLTTYTFRVRAYGTGGDSASSNTAAATTTALLPAAPSGLVATALSNTEIELAWADNSDNEQNFRIERSTDGVNFTPIGSVSADQTTYRVIFLTAGTTYSFRVRAFNASGYSGYSDTASVSTLSVDYPTNLVATANSPTQVMLTWSDNTTDEQGYKIERSTDGVNFSLIATNPWFYGTTYTDSSASAGTAYHYRIRAYNAAGDSASSDTATVATPTVPPVATPLFLSATLASSTQINLSWLDYSTDEQGFEVESSTDGVTFTQIGTTAANQATFQATGLIPGTTYSFRVRAYNAQGDSAYSNAVAAMPRAIPAAPAGLTATPAGNDRINLAWTDNAVNEQGYKIERSTDGVNFTQIATVGANQTAYTVTNLVPETAYQFRIRAYNAEDSAYSNVADATTITAAVPTAPADLTAVASSSSQVTLTWVDTSDNEQGYKIERSADGVNFTQVGTAFWNVTSYVDAGLIPGATYTYRVRAYSSAGDSPSSNSSGVTTLLLNAPRSLSAAVASGTQINLTWYDDSANETGFKVERSTDGVTFVEIATAPAGPYGSGFAVTYPVTGLTPGTTYSFRVRGTNVTGNSTYSNIVTARTSTVPAAPGNLTATPASNDRINLAWTDNAVNEQGYKIERSTDGVNFTPIGTAGANQTSYAATGLTLGTIYSFRVRAYNGDDSADSNVATATPAAIRPAAPTNLTATVASNVQINLSWTDTSDNEDGYKIERSTDGATFVEVGTAAPGSLWSPPSFQVTGLDPATTYQFRVRAYNAAGDSDPSTTISATTAAYPVAPTGLTAAATSASEIQLAWQDVGNETGYKIERSPNGYSWTQVGTVGADVTTFTDGGLSENTSYWYRVLASNAAGNSSYSATATATIPLAPPDNATATFVSGGRIDVTWTDRSGIESAYYVEQSLDGVTGWVQVGSVGANVTSFAAPGPFSPSTPYYFRVRASSNFAGDSAYSPTAIVTTPAVPLIPTDVTAVPTSDTSITITWTAMANADGYSVERSANGATGWTLIATLGTSQTTFDDTGLTEGTAAYYRVRATDAVFAFVSEASDVGRATTLPTAPSGLQVTAIDGGQVQLHWQDNSTIEGGYSIAELIDGTYQEIQEVGPGTTDATVAGVFDPSTSYSFEVRAFATLLHFGTQYSLASNVAQVTTGAWAVVPSSLTATAASASEIDLSWADNAGSGAAYEVDRSADGGSTWTEIATVPSGSGGTAQYADTGLTGGELAIYDYRVRATEAGVGDSAYSDIAGTATLLATPTDLTATITDGGEVELIWIGNSALATGYIVEQWIDGGWQEVQQTVGAAQSLTRVGTYDPGTTYTFRVLADMETDSAEANSAPSNEATVTPAAWPVAPTDLTTTVNSNSQIDLTWTDNATDATSYEIDRSTDGVTWTVLTDTLPAGTQSYSDTGLADGTMYGYRVRAVNGAGGSGYAMGAAATLPTAPLNLQATVVSGTEIDLSWDASTYATGYTISIRPEGSDTWQVIGAVPASQTTYAATGLEPGGTYYAFCVAPTNSTADSAIAYLDPPTQNAAPEIESPTASTSYDPVTGTTMTLSAIAIDDRPVSQLVYSWSVFSRLFEDNGTFKITESNVSFSKNNSNAASTTIVTFYQAGDYSFDLKVTDANGRYGAASFSVTVNQTLTGIVITPGDAGVLAGQTRQFTAHAIDQFGDDMEDQPDFTWSVEGDGAGGVDANGLYTAPEDGDDASVTVSASSGNVTGKANVVVLGGSTTMDLVQDQDPVSIDQIDLSQYHSVTRIAITPADAAGLHYDDFSFDTPQGHVTIDFGDLATGTVVTNQYAGVTFNGGTVSDDTQMTHVYKPPGGWGGTIVVEFKDPVNNLKFSTGWVDSQKGETYAQVSITTVARLLELTVADSNNSSNSETAVKGIDQQIYVPEDQDTHTAEVDIRTAFSPSNGGKKIHIRVAYDDGTVIFDGNRTSLDALTLTVGEDGNRDFVITAWVDANNNGQPDAGEDKLEVDVSVVKPWSAVGTWATGVAALVKANADGASLQQLALDITGNADDADQVYPDMKPIKKGDLIDVTGLLGILEVKVRDNIVDAATNPNIQDNDSPSIEFGSLYFDNSNVFYIGNVGEAELNRIFGSGWTGPRAKYNCMDMAEIIWARGLQMSLKEDEFDKIIKSPKNLNARNSDFTVRISNNPLNMLQPGDWVVFDNIQDEKTSMTIIETDNAIALRGNNYYVWNLGQRTDLGIRNSLLTLYNKKIDAFNGQLWDEHGMFTYLFGGASKASLKDIPGYQGEAYFLNIPKLGQAIFNLRTGNIQ